MGADGGGGSSTRAERLSWCLFDFANSAFNTIVLTFVFAPFFASVLAGDERRGGVLWSRALTVSGLLIAVLSPLLGGMADRAAHKKRYLAISTSVTIACTALLFLPAVDPGLGRAPDAAIWLALAMVVVGNLAFEVSFVFYNAFLPGLADPAHLGRLSGFGWACGYVGGLFCLALCLGMVRGFGGEPWLPATDHVNIRATALLVAGWFGLFSLPMFALVRDRTAAPAAAPCSPAPTRKARAALAQLAATLRGLPRHRDLLRLLVAHLFYNDAIVALIVLSGLYMEAALGMSQAQILAMGIVLNVVSGLGALLFGFIDDALGAKTVLVGSTLLLLAGALLAIAVPTPGAFALAAGLVGLGMGPNQAASRTMLARFVDPRRGAEYYGLFALSGKATVWMGPLLFSVVLEHTGSHRAAFVPLLGMLAVGLVIVCSIDERRGVAAARGG